METSAVDTSIVHLRATFSLNLSDIAQKAE